MNAKLKLHKIPNTDEEALNELLAIAYEAETFIRSVVGYQDSAIANHLASAIEKVQGKKYLAIGRLAARVVYRNSQKAVEHSVHPTDGMRPRKSSSKRVDEARKKVLAAIGG